GRGGAAPAAPIRPITCPDVTVVPSGTLISCSTPSSDAGTSNTTLSVSTSASTSPRLTGSPGFLRHATSVPSVTDSGNVGTATSAITSSSFRGRASAALFLITAPIVDRGACGRVPGSGGPRRERGGAVRAPSGPDPRLDRSLRPRAEGLIEQLLQLLQMQVVVAHGRGGHGRASGILDLAPGRQGTLQPVPRGVPGSLVARLFLAPDERLRARIAAQLRGQAHVRERVQLLDAQDRRVRELALLPLGQQVVVHLAAARDDAAHRLRVELVHLRQQRLERALGQILERAEGLAQAQQAL